MRRWSELLLAVLVAIGIAGCTETPKPNSRSKVQVVTPGPVDPDAPEEFTTTESGLRYRIRRKSDGKKPTEEQMVYVHLRGWTQSEGPAEEGKTASPSIDIFETSYGTGGREHTLELKQRDPGFREALQLIGEGGMIEFNYPVKLAFGDKIPPRFKPDQHLHFLVELNRVSDPPTFDTEPSTPGPSSSHAVGKVDPDAPEEFTTTASGLKYRIRRKSDGKKPTPASTVKVHYRGWLDSGAEFDSSYSRNQPASFGLGQVVRGWTEGLQLVGEGGMIELEIPSDLGYGDEGRPPSIPPKATLHFTVELLEVK